MKPLFIRSAAIFISFLVVASATAAGRGRGSGGGGGRTTTASGGGNYSGRAYRPDAPRFNGAGAQRYSSLPHHTFPKAGVTEHSVRERPKQPPATVQRQAGHVSKWSHNNQAGKSTLDPQTRARLRNWNGKRDNSLQATAEHREHKHNHHDHDWWKHHCIAIVYFDWGYWGWEDGWWFPAWGYDPEYSTYSYDGPIYGYGGLPPDQIVADVQGALQRLGYYQYAIDGVLGPATQVAIERYQSDRGLPVTGGIDPATLASLGFTR